MMELLWVLDELLMTSLFLFIVSVFIDRIFPTVLVDEIFLGVADAIAGLRSGDRIVVVGSDEEEENQEGGVGDIDFGKLVEEEEEDEAVDTVSEGEIVMDEAVGEIRLEDKEVKLSEHDDTGVDDDDDWEGIEQTPTGELFAIANDYFGSTVGKEELSGLGPDVQLQVYALSKVAIDGPCYGPQPLSLKPSSRARWYDVVCPGLLEFLVLNLLNSTSMQGMLGEIWET